MADFNIIINADEVAGQIGQKAEDIKRKLKQSVQGLAGAAHAKVLELAGEKLRSLQSKYKDAVSFEQVDDSLWVVTLDASARWIEDGHGAWSMYDSLAKSSKAKTSKEGNKYMAIPFEHSKKPSDQSVSAQRVTNHIRDFLKKEKVPYKKIEYNADGSPKLGLLHRFNTDKSPGLLMKHPSSKAKSPLLQGLAIYQRTDSEGKVKRDVMTFRMISEKTKGDGRWEYESRQGVDIFRQTHEWAKSAWENDILPALIESLK